MIARYNFNFARGPGPRSPINVNAGEYVARPATGASYYPDVATYPNGAGIGMVSGLLPQFDAFVYAQMVARLPWGPEVNGVPLDPTRYTTQAVFPMLPQIGSSHEVSP